MRRETGSLRTTALFGAGVLGMAIMLEAATPSAAWARDPHCRVASQGAAEFSIDTLGRVVRNDGVGMDGKNKVAFFEGVDDAAVVASATGAKLLVRLSGVSSRSPDAAQGRPPTEKSVAIGARYSLPDKALEGTDVWHLEVYSPGYVQDAHSLSYLIARKNRPPTAVPIPHPAAVTPAEPEVAAATASREARSAAYQAASAAADAESAEELIVKNRNDILAKLDADDKAATAAGKSRTAANAARAKAVQTQAAADQAGGDATNGAAADEARKLAEAMAEAVRAETKASDDQRAADDAAAAVAAASKSLPSLEAKLSDAADRATAAAERADKAKEAAEEAKGAAAADLVAASQILDELKGRSAPAIARAQKAKDAADETVKRVAPLVEDAEASALEARARADAATAALDKVGSLAGKPPTSTCYSLFGVFELPTTPVSRTATMNFSGIASSSSPAGAVTMHGSPVVTAWATQVARDEAGQADRRVSFTWKITGNTSTDLPSVLVGALQSVFPGKLPAPVKSQTELWEESPPLPELLLCPIATTQLASFRSAAQTSDALVGGLVRNRSYLVTASIGDGKAPSSDGTWTVSKATGGGGDDLYTVKGPKLQASASASASSEAAGNPKKAQAQFNSTPGWDWALLTSLTYDSDLETLAQSSQGNGSFPAYQWRPTTAGGAAQQVYILDNAYQPLQRASLSVLVALLFPEGRGGRAGIGVGPTLLWGTGTNGTLQQWTASFLYSPPIDALVDKLYIVTGTGFRFVNDLVGDTAGETVAVPRVNGNAPSPSGPTTRSRAVWVATIGIAFNLSVITKAVASLTGGKSSTGGQ